MEGLGTRFRRLNTYRNVENNDEAVDIRGFKVLTLHGIEIGKVETIIADDQTDVVRYIEVNTKDHMDSPLNHDNEYRQVEKYKDRFENGKHYMLLPIGLANIDRENLSVFVDGITLQNLYTGPRHSKDDDINARYEVAVVDKYVQDKGSDFTEKYGQFVDTEKSKLDNHFYEKKYFQTRRSKRGAPTSPVL